MSLTLSAPQPLAATHLLNDFECGEHALDEWLKRRAMTNQLSCASRTFVVVDEENRVRGFYAMPAGAVTHQMLTSTVRRNMPDPIPVMVLGRLAVDRRAQGIKLGAAMLCKMQSIEPSTYRKTRAFVRCSFMHSTSRPSSSMSITAFRSHRIIR